MLERLVGFTLIELVIVIVILGILAVVAIPQFIDLSQDAKLVAVQGVAGALSSANAINYASRKANSTNGAAISNCSQVASLLVGATLPSSSYAITAAAITAGVTTNCTITYTPSSGTTVSATFTATGIN